MIVLFLTSFTLSCQSNKTISTDGNTTIILRKKYYDKNCVNTKVERKIVYKNGKTVQRFVSRYSPINAYGEPYFMKIISFENGIRHKETKKLRR